MQQLPESELKSIYSKLPQSYRHKLKVWRNQYKSNNLDKKIKITLSENGLEGLLLDFTNTAIEKRNKLIEMAKNGEPRPGQKTHPLGKSFGQYIDPKSNCYDEKFANEIKNLRPDWFEGLGRKSTALKQQIKNLALSNSERPESKTELGKALIRYTTATGNCFDEEFKNEIMQLAPQWFKSKNDKNFRDEILKIASEGGAKPYWKTEMGGALIRYTNKSQNGYDEDFDKKVRAIRPEWFKIRRAPSHSKKSN